ncbi:MAG: sulfatase, partial [Thermoanaerobaculia bacterium]|nr:sulfatase [Thermoanaerobaculia bacterium]
MTKLRRRLILARLAVASTLLGALSCGGPRVPEGSSILLITIDTLRADHLSMYGYERQTSPVLDGLAAEGVRFDQATVQWPKTGPSFASIFTATFPKNNRIVRKIGIPLPQKFLMLAEVLRGLGYQTHAVVANGAVASDFHFDQGFDSYVESWTQPPRDDGADPNAAGAVNELVAALLPQMDPDKPFFLWVHYLDPHFPYTPPPPYTDMFQGDEHFDPSVRLEIDRSRQKFDMMKLGRQQVLDERDDLAFYVARYDAEIAYNDSKVGELMAMLTEAGLMERTLTVMTSDHGESLGEHHYYFDHGRFGFQTCLNVPLFFHYPGVLEPRVVSDPVMLVHLTPTLLEVAGVELEDGAFMQGRSLLPRLLGRERQAGDEPDYVYSEAGYGRRDMWQRIVRDERFKFVYAQEGEAQRWITGSVGKELALYDL